MEIEGFQFYSTNVYPDKHDMIEIIARARQIVDREISVRLGFSERVLVPGGDANYLDHNLGKYSWVGQI